MAGMLVAAGRDQRRRRGRRPADRGARIFETGGTPEGAATAYREASDDSDVLGAFLGASGALASPRPIRDASGCPVITASGNDAIDIPVTPFVFSNSAGQRVRDVGDHLRRQPTRGPAHRGDPLRHRLLVADPRSDHHALRGARLRDRRDRGGRGRRAGRRVDPAAHQHAQRRPRRVLPRGSQPERVRRRPPARHRGADRQRAVAGRARSPRRLRRQLRRA